MHVADGGADAPRAGSVKANSRDHAADRDLGSFMSAMPPLGRVARLMARWPYLRWPAEAQQLALANETELFHSTGNIRGAVAWLIGSLTYGTQTGLAWAVDLGRGIGRHPVQLYDIIDDGSVPDRLSAGAPQRAALARAHPFHTLIVVYAVAAICVAIPETLPDPGGAI
jgi:hypothetical protein